MTEKFRQKSRRVGSSHNSSARMSEGKGNCNRSTSPSESNRRQCPYYPAGFRHIISQSYYYLSQFPAQALTCRLFPASNAPLFLFLLLGGSTNEFEAITCSALQTRLPEKVRICTDWKELHHGGFLGWEGHGHCYCNIMHKCRHLFY